MRFVVISTFVSITENLLEFSRLFHCSVIKVLCCCGLFYSCNFLFCTGSAKRIISPINYYVNTFFKLFSTVFSSLNSPYFSMYFHFLNPLIIHTKTQCLKAFTEICKLCPYFYPVVFIQKHNQVIK
ncbi:hypothetical protein HNQ54_002111 [Anaerocolumna cellulosilytica]|nr:hypothetical protein [Anaerocolumna cellulosilytica]